MDNPTILTTAKPPSGLRSWRTSLISKSRENIHGSVEQPFEVFGSLTKTRSLSDLSKTVATQKTNLLSFKANEKSNSERYIVTSLRKPVEETAFKIYKKESTSKNNNSLHHYENGVSFAKELAGRDKEFKDKIWEHCKIEDQGGPLGEPISASNDNSELQPILTLRKLERMDKKESTNENDDCEDISSPSRKVIEISSDYMEADVEQKTCKAPTETSSNSTHHKSVQNELFDNMHNQQTMTSQFINRGTSSDFAKNSNHNINKSAEEESRRIPSDREINMQRSQEKRFNTKNVKTDSSFDQKLSWSNTAH